MSPLSDAQKEGLAKTIRRIKKFNPEYAQSFGLPEKIETYEELSRLPFLTKDMLRLGYPFGYLCDDKKNLARMHMSSGTTGTPIINSMTPNDVQNWAEIMCRCLKTAGLNENDVLQVTPSFGLFNGGFGFHFGAQKLGAFIIPAGAGRSGLQLKLMRDLGVTALAAIASYPLRLLEIARQENFDFSQTKLKTGIFGAEVWSDGMRKRIEQVTTIKTYDIIGMTETGGVGMGIDCADRSGIHIWDDFYIVEIIDPKTGKQLPDGQEGEMVITTLAREGLPLIRYRTSDITRIVSREKCACGLHTIKVARLKGRCDDMLKVKGVNFYPSQVESVLMLFPEIGENYTIVLEDEAGKNNISILMETGPGNHTELRDKIDARIYDLLAFHADISFLPIGSLQRSEGKAKRVIDKRN